MSDQRCRHRIKYGDAVELPDPVALDCFDNCLTPEQRLARWGYIREARSRAMRCLYYGHEDQIAHLTEALERMSAEDAKETKRPTADGSQPPSSSAPDTQPPEMTR